MLHCIFITLLMVGMGLGIWMGCSKNDGVSSSGPVSTKATAPKSVEFQPKAGVNYDPFATMGLDDRKQAIGGPEVATEYLELIVRHLANAMNDKKARPILHKVVPKWDKGEVKLAQIAIEHPDLLNALSKDFKRAIANGAIGGELSRQAQNSPFDGEALLKVSEALFDLELTLVTPPNQGWSPAQAIPVFYMPVNDEEASVMKGVDANLNTITFSLDSEETTFPFLLLNFDEDSPLLNEKDKGIELPTSLQGLGLWDSILNSFSLTSPAYAHYPPFQFSPRGVPHHPCFHLDILQPVKEITIYNDHERWSKPEIVLGVVWPNDLVHPANFDLVDVDDTHRMYTNYAHLRTRHGTCDGLIYKIFIEERDAWFDDSIASWTNVAINSPGDHAILTNRDARLRVVRTTEDVNGRLPSPR